MQIQIIIGSPKNEIIMDATAKENHILRQELARVHGEKDAYAETIASLAPALGVMAARLRESVDAAARKDEDIAVLARMLAIYSGADSPSGKDPKGYEDTKTFLAMARAYVEGEKEGEAAGGGDGEEDKASGGGEGKEPPRETEAKPCGGRPGHRGVSHHVKSDRTVTYTAEMCDACGSTDPELMAPINKPTADFGKGAERKGDTGADMKDARTARVTFGWCGTCKRALDPAPHLVWGTWVCGDALATIIQYKSNPLGRSAIADNMRELHGFVISPGAVSNAITAYAKNLEGRVLPDSAAAFVKAKMEAEGGEGSAGRSGAPPVPESPVPESPVPESPAHPTSSAGPPRRMTRKELKAAGREVPYGRTPQGATDARITCSTTSYLGSCRMSFVERCREWITMQPHMGVDETKTIVMGKWCHSIVVATPRVIMITVRPRKSTRAINWLLGGMRHVCVVHDRIVIYDGFVGLHQECWAHLIRRFLKMAEKYGVGSIEHARYELIKWLYGRAKALAARVAACMGVPSNAAEMAACQYRLKDIWYVFEPEYRSIRDGLLGLVRDLDGQEPGGYLKKMIPRALTFVVCPGVPGTNNVTEGAIRWHCIRPRHVFGALPNWRAARNFGVIQTFAATCRRNGASPYHAVLARGRDPDWDVFTSHAHPPIFPHMG